MGIAFYTLLLAFFLGFIGYLPLGNINLSVVQVSISKKRETLWAFIFFIAFMELVYCIGCLWGLDFLQQQPGWIRVLRWIATALFLILGIISLLHRADGDKLSSAGMKRGIFVAIFNPLQAPYWLVWGVYMMENKLLNTGWLNLMAFGLATAAGTIAVLWLYAVGGKTLVSKLKLRDVTLNRFIGIIFIALAVWQFSHLVTSR